MRVTSFIILCFLLFNKVSAFTHDTSKVFNSRVAIYFGESLNVVNGAQASVGYKTQWKILQNHQVIQEGTGIEILNYSFSTPGIYTILLFTPKDALVCNHLEEISHSIELNVREYSIAYSLDTAFWKSLLSKGKFSGDVVKLPIRISYFKRHRIQIDSISFSVAGVDCSLTGVFKSSKKTRKEKLMVPLTFIGTVKKGVYVMIDFFDSNGNLKSYPVPSKI